MKHKTGSKLYYYKVVNNNWSLKPECKHNYWLHSNNSKIYVKLFYSGKLTLYAKVIMFMVKLV